MSEKMIKRHTAAGIFIHWFNALTWLFLMFTGLGLIQNPALNYLGARAIPNSCAACSAAARNC